MSESPDDLESEGKDDKDSLDDPRLAALVEALAKGEAIDWQQAESSAESAEVREQIRALAAISEVATFHRTWLAEGGILGDLEEEEELDDEMPTHWGELEILERVGRGSFGDVYKAREPRLDRIVALKLIRASARTPEREAETLREGRLLAKVRHPNVATVYGAAGADGRVGFWMEFLEGKNLAEILKEQGRFGAREAAEIGIALCRALAAVHAQGIIHRDVKAQNVVRENDGRIVLTDFGVGRDTALLSDEEPSLSGTPLYLAPELFEGKLPSPASDLYALGVLLFYLVTGEFPVTGSSFEELRAAHQGRKRRWLKELRKDLPGTFVAAVERALDRDPEKRVGEVGMEKELGRFLGERVQIRRLRQLSVVVAVIAGATLVGTFLYYKEREDHRNRVLSEVAHFEASNDPWKAIRVLEVATKEDKDFTEGFSRLSDLVTNERDKVLAAEEKADGIDEKIHILEDATQRDRAFVAGWTQLGLRLQTKGDHVRSREAYSEANTLCLQGESTDCLRAKAYYQLSCSVYEKALPLFEKVVAREPSDRNCWRQLGMLHGNIFEPKGGVRAAQRAGQLDPQNPVAVGLLALVLAQDSDPRAVDAALTARRQLPHESYLYWVEGLAELTSGDKKRALKTFEYLEKSPDFTSYGQIFKGQTLAEEGKLADAEALISSGLSSDDGNSTREVEQRYILLAEIAYQRKDTDGARENLKKLLDPSGDAIPLIPENFKYFRSAAVIAVRVNDLDLAQRFLEKLLALDKNFHSKLSQELIAHVQGEIFRAKNNSEEALRQFENALAIRNDPFLQASRIRLLVELGECVRAVSSAHLLEEKPGLFYGDYTIPWTEIREAIYQARHCTPK